MKIWPKRHFKVILFLLTSLPALSFAQSKDHQEDILDIYEKPAHKKEKIIDNAKFLERQKILSQDNTMVDGAISEQGFQKNVYFTGDDHHLFHLQGFVTGNLTKFQDLKSFEAGYAYRWGVIWFEVLGSYTDTIFKEIAQNPSITNPAIPTSDLNMRRPLTAIQTLQSFGGGLGYRFRMIHYALDLEEFFETVSAYLMYHNLNDAFTKRDYTGPGLRTDFGIHRRLTSSTHVGLKLSYNLASVSRDKVSQLENKRDRSLTLNWLSLGMDLGFYF